MQENWSVIERGAPLEHRAVIMRMRNCDAAQSAEAGNQFDGRVVDQRNAIPKKIAVRRSQEQGPLPDRKFRDGADADQVRFVLAKTIAMTAAQLFQRRPFLAELRDELPGIAADRTGNRQRG